jgi:predicted nuclease of predicted toxin-antitoxin system
VAKRSDPSGPREIPGRRPAACRLASRLIELGHDAAHTSSLPEGNRTTDQQIAATADLDGRIVVTKDADFRNSHLLTGSPARLLVVATGNIRNDDLSSLFESRLAEIEDAFGLGEYVELRRDAVVSHPRAES